MDWTRTDAARRWIVVAGLVIGPVLAVSSSAVGLGLDGPGSGGDSMRTQFATMGAHASQILTQDLLETFGFLLVLSALAGATQALRVRGGALGTTGAVLAMLGIVGFSMSNAAGMAIVALAQQPDQDAAFQIAMDISSRGVLTITSTIAFVLEMAASVGMLLIIGGLVRARMVSLWPLLVPVPGIIGVAVVGTTTAVLAADVLLLVACTWIAVCAARCPHAAWLGAASVPTRSGRRNALASHAAAER